MLLKIKKIRASKKLTQDEVVSKTSIKKRTYVDYENGKGDIPLSKLKEIALALEVNVSELIGEEVEKPASPQDNDNQKLQSHKTQTQMEQIIKAYEVTIESQKTTIESLQSQIELLKTHLGLPNKQTGT